MGACDVRPLLRSLRAARDAHPTQPQVYKTDILRRFGSALPERLMQEIALQEELVKEGYELHHAPDSVIWHLNESRPALVLGDSYYLIRTR
jgi:hypothetical protein